MAPLFSAALKALNRIEAAAIFIKQAGRTTDKNSTRKLVGNPTIIDAAVRKAVPLTTVPIPAANITFI